MTLREYLTANLFDGDDGGIVTQQTSALLDDICENVAWWAHGLGSVRESPDIADDFEADTPEAAWREGWMSGYCYALAEAAHGADPHYLDDATVGPEPEERPAEPIPAQKVKDLMAALEESLGMHKTRQAQTAGGEADDAEGSVR